MTFFKRQTLLILFSQLVVLVPIATNAVNDVNSIPQEIVQQVEQPELKLVATADVTEYLVNRLVTVKVRLSGTTEDPIRVKVNFKSRKPWNQALECVDCSKKTLNLPEVSEEFGDNRLAIFTWRALQPAQLTIYFEIERAGPPPSMAANRQELPPLRADLRKAFVQISIGRSVAIFYASAVCGWLYIVCWMFGLYSQLIVNFMRKSCDGLNLDYVVLNVTGFAAYAIFNVCLYCIPSFQNEFELRNPHSNIPVEINDVVFALHHTAVALAISLQCLFFKTGGQSMNLSGVIVTSAIFSPTILLGYYVLMSQFSKLDYIYFFSYVKLWLTVGKYIPQAIFHFRRKSTQGWSVCYSFLDMAGGILSLLQTFVLIYNYDDWTFLVGNYSKFGIGLATIMFDVLFLIQHYLLYPESKKKPTLSPITRADLGTININFVPDSVSFRTTHDKNKLCPNGVSVRK